MNKHLQAFIDKVRSGIWTKADSSFTDGPGRYCILGAMAKAYEEMTGNIMYEDGEYLGRNQHSLPEKVWRFFGLKEKSPEITYDGEVQPLYQINDDSDLSLQQIADLMVTQEAELVLKEKKPDNYGAPIPEWMKQKAHVPEMVPAKKS